MQRMPDVGTFTFLYLFPNVSAKPIFWPSGQHIEHKPLLIVGRWALVIKSQPQAYAWGFGN